MCSCKMVEPPSSDSGNEDVVRNRTLSEMDDLLSGANDGAAAAATSPDADADDFEQEEGHDTSVGGDISCVGVPLAALPGIT